MFWFEDVEPALFLVVSGTTVYNMEDGVEDVKRVQILIERKNKIEEEIKELHGVLESVSMTRTWDICSV